MDSRGIIPCKKQRIAPPVAATATSTNSTTIEDLKDDEIVEILIRLPLECVFRCKCISKRWLALISHPCFITSFIGRRQNLPLRDHLIIYQVYLEDECVSDHYGHLPMPLVFYPPNISDQYPISDPTGKFFDFTFRFLPFNLEDRFTSFGLVRNSRGLLLCKGELIKSRTSSPQSSHRQSEYYVCNPLTKQWLRIPKLDRRMSFKVDYVGFTCYALDTRLPHKVEFVVLEVEKKRRKEDEFFYTRVFSSLTGCWSVYRVACPPGPSWPSRESTGMYGNDYDPTLYDYGTIAVYKGMFHWNGGSCLIAYDPLNEPYKCSSIPIPEELANNGSRVGLSEGRIRMATYSLENSSCARGTYSVYELTDYDIGKWDLKFFIKKPILNMLLSFSSQTNGEIIFMKWFLSGARRKFVLYNMKSQSVVGDFDIPEHPTLPRLSFSADSFLMTAWPTVIPQLPHNL